MVRTTIRGITLIALLMAVPQVLHVNALGAGTQIASFNGAGDKPADTPPFTTHGGKVRFVFSVEPNSSGPVPFLAKMYLKGSPATANELRRTQCIDCKGQQTDDLGNLRAGSYYLHVITSRPWTLVVDETK